VDRPALLREEAGHRHDREFEPNTIRAAITAAIKDAGYVHIPKGRRDHPPAEALCLHGLD
jgi:hypothetical protein